MYKFKIGDDVWFQINLISSRERFIGIEFGSGFIIDVIKLPDGGYEYIADWCLMPTRFSEVELFSTKNDALKHIVKTLEMEIE